VLKLHVPFYHVDTYSRTDCRSVAGDPAHRFRSVPEGVRNPSGTLSDTKLDFPVWHARSTQRSSEFENSDLWGPTGTGKGASPLRPLHRPHRPLSTVMQRCDIGFLSSASLRLGTWSLKS